ncbi:MarR family winged helix-turn-helix transcriptional regulator [Marinomonas arenicola]|uniref:MarR family transcriptional regulator n=1 Tax=Marinomonas arenicola TaxID=569601 RepID=A0ABU9G7H5_9GAMM
MPTNTSLENLFHLVHALKQQMHRHIEELGLNITAMHIRTISIINDKGSCTASEVASFLQRDKAQITRLLNALIKDDLITKENNPDDKRSQCLRLTDKGLHLLKQIKGIEKTIFKMMSNGMSEETLESFQQVTKQLTRNLTG